MSPCLSSEGEKPFECRLCGQRSRDYSAMIKHLRTHGGAAPYQCTACRDFCSSLVAMQKHVKKHSEQDFPPDWTISWTYLYTSHLLQHNMGYSENCKDLQTRWSQILKKCIPCEMEKILPGSWSNVICRIRMYNMQNMYV
ncbi:Zinc finger and BTB domain-containing protein 16-A [Merluccius polli]|uniref:Zinc finger and BTB domain-containing protein 16-A n=1 Tax=Merluccius polli TaxID=89951 RepID=A0AA47MJX6_MERPO|nr:Zinc finger and BTB domain-containing protein 16-A [Merluccius polli]